MPLPTTGIIQLFHDLVTYGEPGDADRRAWRVRWIEKGVGEDHDRFELQAPPADIDEDRAVEVVPLNTEVSATIPRYVDLPAGSAEFDRYARVYDWLGEYPHQRNMMRRARDDNPLTPWQEGYTPSDRASRMCGFGFVWTDPDREDELRRCLPLAEGDEHVLLFEVNPVQCDAPLGWFHGRRPLQVWIRASDLARKHFDDVWCQIRTDA